MPKNNFPWRLPGRGGHRLHACAQHMVSVIVKFSNLLSCDAYVTFSCADRGFPVLLATFSEAGAAPQKGGQRTAAS